MSKPTSAEAYREHIKNKAEIVEVKPPSGFIFKFKKPNFFGMALGTLFSLSPENLKKAMAGEKFNDEPNTIEQMFRIRDKVLELSHEPKIVIGEAKNKGELSTEDISNEDLLYLFAWVSSGSDPQTLKTMFAKAGK